jgi:hypothetical protein
MADEVYMSQVISIKTKVLPGGRVEVFAPGFREGDVVDVLVRPNVAPNGRRSMLDLIGSMPAGTRSAADWEALERALREERDAWDR